VCPGGKFKIKAINHYKNKMDLNSNIPDYLKYEYPITIFLIACDSKLLNYIADRDDLEVYNKKKLFIEPFI